MSASREKRDVYYRLAKQTGLRARSAFKLLQLNRTCQFLDGSNVLDLCAAPGGWSALCQQILQNNKQLDNTTSQTDVNETHPEDAFISPPKVIAVDCVTIDPIPGVSIILGDISRPSTARDILKETNGKQMDVVLFDGAPDVIGQLDFDETIQHSLILSGAILCLSVLRNGGQYVAKIFRGAQTSKTCSILACLFDEVYMAKPQASRNSSLEGFVICQGFNPHESLRALPLQVILSLGLEQAIRLTNDPPKDADHRFGNGPGKRAGPEFIPCPDIYDADKSYSLGEDLQYNFN